MGGAAANATSDVACIIGIIVFFSGVISCISLLIICANIEETLHKEFIDSVCPCHSLEGELLRPSEV